MIEDVEINNKVYDLIEVLKKKNIQAIKRRIGEYFVEFKYSKDGQPTPDNSSPVNTVTDKLNNMGNKLMEAFG